MPNVHVLVHYNQQTQNFTISHLESVLVIQKYFRQW